MDGLNAGGDSIWVRVERVAVVTVPVGCIMDVVPFDGVVTVPIAGRTLSLPNPLEAPG